MENTAGWQEIDARVTAKTECINISQMAIQDSSLKDWEMLTKIRAIASFNNQGEEGEESEEDAVTVEDLASVIKKT